MAPTETPATCLVLRQRASVDALCAFFLILDYACIRRVRRIIDTFRTVFVPAGPIMAAPRPWNTMTLEQARVSGFFPVGVWGSMFDEHAHTRAVTPGAEPLSEGRRVRASIDLLIEGVEAELAREAGAGWAMLEQLLNMISANDDGGPALSRDKENLRNAVDGANALEVGDPILVCYFFAAAMRALVHVGGLVATGQSTLDLSDPFSRATIEAAVRIHNPGAADAFCVMYKAALDFRARAWEQGKKDWKHARCRAHTSGMGCSATCKGSWPERRYVDLPQGRNADAPETVADLRTTKRKQVIAYGFTSSSFQAIRVARAEGALIAVVRNPTGHMQIVTSTTMLEGGRHGRIDDTPILVAVRLAELKKRRLNLERALASHGKPDREGFWADERWGHFFVGMIPNSTLGNTNIPPTTLTLDEVLDVIAAHILRCTVMIVD